MSSPRLLLLVAALVLTLCPAFTDCTAPCAAPRHRFSKQLGDDREQIGYAVATDSAGNILLAGSVAGTVDFGSGPITLAGASNAFVAKFNRAGRLRWVHRYDAASSFVAAVAVDGDDNVLLAGGFRDPIDLGGGPLPNPYGGLQVTFVAKLDPNGRHVWSRSAAGNEFHYPRGVAADPWGNVLVSGSFESFFDISDGISPIFGRGGLFDEDIFVAKLDGGGQHLWTRGFGTTSIDRGEGVATDSDGDVVLAGFFIGGPIDFGGEPLAGAGSADAFVAKLDPDGGHVWSRAFGDPGSQDAAAVAVGPDDSIVVTGGFNGDVDFGEGPLRSAGENDVFVIKLDEDGGTVWSRGYGDAARQDGTAIAVDARGNVAVSGFFRGAIDFVCAPLVSAGQEDIFLARLDAGGDPVWSARYGDAAGQTPTSVALDGRGAVVLTGYYEGVLDFGGGPLVSQGDRDAFLAKLTR